MRRGEWLARILVGLLLVGAVGAPLWISSRTPLIHARMADSGGWSMTALRARVGEPLRLRLTSDDVMHSFAVGQMSMQAVDIEPGKVSDVTLTFHKPGTYTFYCTRWCGVNHWRMRGTIEVTGDQPAAAGNSVPLYVQLGLDVDEPHLAPVTPGERPSASGGALLANGTALSAFTDPAFYRAHSPSATWQQLRDDTALASRTDKQLWEMVAFIWQANTTPQDVAEGRALFQQNCAACHGPAGAANGVFADQLAAAGAGGGMNMMVQRPADLSNGQRVLGAAPALLAGKIMRGGMGTGMPSWGPIFSERQIWNIVSYIYTFHFKEFTK